MHERHPQAPDESRYRVREAFTDVVSRRFGSVYSFSPLSRRSSDETGKLFSPVVVGPGDIPMFSWPAVELDEQWLEPA